MLVAPNNSVRQPGREPLTAAQYFQQLQAVMGRVPYFQIEEIIQILLKACQEEKNVFVFGNGGSAASASHMVCDLNRLAGESAAPCRIKAMALADNVPVLTACANDRGYETVFSEQLRNFAQAGDVAFAISCSGDSANVVLGLTTARELGAITIGLSGFDGGAIRPLCQVCAVVPSEHVQMIEDVHHAMLHSISAVLRARMSLGRQHSLTMVAGHGD